MRVHIRHPEHRGTCSLQVDPENPPRVVRAPGRGDDTEREHYLDWDRAFDDEGHLRKCPSCGCPELFLQRTFPPLTGFLVVLTISLLVMAFYGLAHAPLALVVGIIGAVAVANVLIIFFSPRWLVCYRCGSRYGGMPFARDQKPWSRGVSERHRQAGGR